MAFTPLTATVRHNGQMAIIDLVGDIDGSAESILNSAYTEASANTPASVLLNFSRVGYINSTGIALIVSLLAQARKTHTPLLVSGLSEHYAEIFRITRLSDFMQVYADEASALAQVDAS
jgi:anti-anti-sigma factor